MATKNNRRILVTKKILKDSLMELMKEKPISKISIKEICDLSEMSRSTFYLHYQDQFELLADIEKEVLENTEKALGNLDNAFGTPDSIEVYLNYELEQLILSYGENVKVLKPAELKTKLQKRLTDACQNYQK